MRKIGGGKSRRTLVLSIGAAVTILASSGVVVVLSTNEVGDARVSTWR